MTTPSQHPDRPPIEVDAEQMRQATSDPLTIGLVNAIERVLETRTLSVRRRLSGWQGVWWWELWSPADPDAALTMSLSLAQHETPNVIWFDRTLVVTSDGFGSGELMLRNPLATTVSSLVVDLLRSFSIHRTF